MFIKYDKILGETRESELPREAYFVKNGYNLELWWYGTKMHTWTYEPPVATAGSPIGLLLTLTYA